MINKILLTIIFSTYIFAASININDNINTFSLPDQFDKKHTINNTTKTIIISFEKGTGKTVSDFLVSKKPNFLQNNQAVFIADISEMPAFVTKYFALPKMRKYKHKILLIYKENDGRFLKKEEVSTVYKLDNGVVKAISYSSSTEDLEKIFN